jgi:hypothetical protein
MTPTLAEVIAERDEARAACAALLVAQARARDPDDEDPLIEQAIIDAVAAGKGWVSPEVGEQMAAVLRTVAAGGTAYAHVIDRALAAYDKARGTP